MTPKVSTTGHWGHHYHPAPLPPVDPEWLTLKHNAFVAQLFIDEVDLQEPTHQKPKKQRGRRGKGGREETNAKTSRLQGKPGKKRKTRGRGAHRQGPGHPGAETSEGKRQRGHREREEEKKQYKKKEGKQKDKNGATPAWRGPSKAEGQSGHRKSEAHQNAAGRPPRPTKPRRASTRTQARDPGVASSDPKKEMLASTRNSPSAPAESRVKRRTVRETGRVSDRVHTHKPPQRTPPKTDAGTTPSRGAKRVRRGANPAPLPQQGPAVGTMSPVLGRPPRAPSSRPGNRGAKTPWVAKGTIVSGKPTRAPRAA